MPAVAPAPARFSRSMMMAAGGVAVLFAITVALWSYYGTAVFFEVVRAGWSACF